MTLAMGVDGGGTQTRCLIIDEQANVIGLAVGGASKPDAVNFETGRTRLQQLVQEACQRCGGPEAIDTVFLGMGGVISAADEQVIRDMLVGLPFRSGAPVGVDHDIRIALAGATAGQPGVALIVGTGSSAYGRNQAGDSWRSGGWGFLIDDVGSGYFLGQQALTAVVRAHDGRGPETALTTPILNALGVNSIDELTHRIYHPQPDTGGIAALAPVVTAMAEDDLVAYAIIERGCAELATMVQATVQALNLPDEVVVVPVGSLATLSQVFRRVLYRCIIQVLPRAQITPALAPPVAGAVFLALQQVGLTLDETVLGKLQGVV